MNTAPTSWEPPVYAIHQLKKPHDFHSLFSRPAPILLELGAGKGEFAQRVALNRPDWNLLCVEIRAHRVRSIVKKCKGHDLRNITILQARFEHLIPHCFFPGFVDEIHMNFPDPWIKWKQRNRRMMTMEFVESLAYLLKPGGSFHFATDIEAYADHSLELLEECRWFRNTHDNGSYTNDPEPYQKTLFYHHALKAGRKSAFLKFERV